MKIIQYYSILFNRVLNQHSAQAGPAPRRHAAGPRARVDPEVRAREPAHRQEPCGLVTKDTIQ